MTLQLARITFNSDISSTANSAMNIRRNRNYEIALPEFRKQTASSFEFNCAAYAIAETQDHTVYIRVQLEIPPGANENWEIKATGGGIMGSIDPIQVNFSPGSTTQTVDVPLAHRNFSKVCRYDITWQWYYRSSISLSWQLLRTTSHRIYLVLNVPPSPWTQAYADVRNPWSELLDECCSIASGCKNAVQASRRTVKAVYGNYNLRYDIHWGAPRYISSSYGTWNFELDNWISFILNRNVPPNPRFCPSSPEDYPNLAIVNCYDCAGSLSLMSKVIGANNDYYFHNPFGYLNYVYPIGRGKCNNPFPTNHCSGSGAEVGPNDPRSRFGNHAYTKLGSKVFDACTKNFVTAYEKLILAIIIIILFIVTLGQADLSYWIDRYYGWLVNMPQSEYDRKTVDTSETFEATANGGHPSVNAVTF